MEMKEDDSGCCDDLLQTFSFVIASPNNRNRIFALTAKGSRVLHSLKVTAVPSLEISNAASGRLFKVVPITRANWGKVRRDVDKGRRRSHTEQWQKGQSGSVMCAYGQAVG